jgi:hypothetical protein
MAPIQWIWWGLELVADLYELPEMRKNLAKKLNIKINGV